MNTMECCFEIEDLVVPEVYELPEMIASPESWSQWGITGFGGQCLPKNNFNINSNMTREELIFNEGKNFYTSIDVDSGNETSRSNSSSMSQEVNNNGGSHLWNNQEDFQQITEEEEARINDIFFRSLFEEDPIMPHDTTNLGNTTNICEGEMVNSQDVGCSKCLKTTSTEESVLMDLQRVTTQLTEKTRICLRDAFYRLAERSKSSVNFCHDGQHMNMMTSDDYTLRYRETDGSESKTTSIDRYVASLGNLDIEKVNKQHSVSCCPQKKYYNDDAQVPVWTWRTNF